MSVLKLVPSILVVASVTGCVQQYAPPTASEPHAVVKFRRTYEITAGQSLRERVFLDDHQAYDAVSAALTAGQPRTDSILAHPVPVTAHIATGFFHHEMRTVTEHYTVYEQRMTTQMYSCGTGTSYRSCSRTVMQSHPVSRTRLVTKPVEVSDGACEGRVAFAPQNGHVYLLQYTYMDRSACNVQCVEQIPTAVPGEFTSRSCPVAQ